MTGEISFFDPHEPTAIFERKLPHWSQSGVVSFITFRTHDSMPVHVVQQFLADRKQWLMQHGIDDELPDWRVQLSAQSKQLRQEFSRHFSDRWHDELDNCHGECLLKDRSVSKIVVDSLLHFDGDRYEMTDFVVMPNHVHLLVAFASDEWLLKQCESWKRFTATSINRLTGSQGRFWRQDGFDHLVRSEAQFEYLRRYIANNPVKAKLKPGEFWHYTKNLKAIK